MLGKTEVWGADGERATGGCEPPSVVVRIVLSSSARAVPVPNQ